MLNRSQQKFEKTKLGEPNDPFDKTYDGDDDIGRLESLFGSPMKSPAMTKATSGASTSSKKVMLTKGYGDFNPIEEGWNRRSYNMVTHGYSNGDDPMGIMRDRRQSTPPEVPDSETLDPAFNPYPPTTRK